MEAVTEAIDETQYLAFHLAGEEYAIGILRVKEIIEYDTLTAVPMMPVYIRGVINLRGNVVPVVDLAVKFGLPESPNTKRTCIVIVEMDFNGQRTVMGVIADAVSAVMNFSPQDIEAPPAFGTRVQVQYLEGMGKAGKKFVLILNVDRVLSPHDFRAMGAVSVPGSPAMDPPVPDGET